MKRDERKLIKLMQYGIDSELANHLIKLGYGVTKLKSATVKELTVCLGEDTAREIKEKVRRRPITEETLERLLSACHWSCCVCWEVHTKPIVVHHILEYALTQDNSYDNLVVLCLEHHALAHAKSTLTGDLLPAMLLRERKEVFANEIEGWKAGERPIPTPVSGFAELSEPLLQELCETSLQLYASAERFLTDSSSWISRERVVPYDDQVTSLHLLVGDAGFGKSVYAYQTLQRYLLGGYGLWMPPYLVVNSVSLTSALEKLFHELCPQLQPGITAGLGRLVSESQPLLIVVDDVNRAGTENPVQVLEKLAHWSRDWKVAELPICIMCPVWPRFWEAARARFGCEMPWVRASNIDAMTVTEACQAIRNVVTTPMTTISTTELAYRLGYDPFLIGLAASYLSVDELALPGTVAQKIVDRFIADKTREASTISDDVSDLLASDYREALTKLGLQMLEARNLRPTWSTVRAWFRESPEIIQALRRLSRNRDLCRLDTESEVLFFRHDRILEAIAVDGLCETLRTFTADVEMLCEPYYAEWVGKSLAQAPASAKLLEEIGERSLLALVEAIRWFGEPCTDHQRAIIHEIRKQMARRPRGTEGYPEPIRDALLLSLLRTDSPAVLDVTEAHLIDDNWELWRLLARFRNGCTESGIQYCANFGQESFWTPSPYGSLWYQVVEQARQRHGDKIVRKLQECCSLPDIGDVHKTRRYKGALMPAGFLGASALVEHIISGWQAQDDKMQFLGLVVGACIRCYSSGEARHLDPLMAYWAELPDVEESARASPQQVIARCHHVFSFGIADDAAGYLLAQSNRYPGLRPAIAQVLARLDKPEALELAVRTGAELQRQMSGQEVPHKWIRDLEHYWRSAYQKGYRLSKASCDRLRGLWENTDNDREDRIVAFRVWLTNVEIGHLDFLRTIPPTSCLFPDALWTRLRFGDKIAVEDLLPLLTAERHWLRLGHVNWCGELMSAVGKRLAEFEGAIPQDCSGGRLDEHYDISMLLMRIPKEDAQELLVGNWKHLAFSPPFIWAALHVGTPECLCLAEKAIGQCPEQADVLDHLFEHWQMAGVEVSLGHLESLQPYLRCFNDSQLHELARLSGDLGEPGIGWRRRHLLGILESRGMRAHYEPTLETLILALDKLAANRVPARRIIDWADSLRDLGVNKEPLEILEPWLASNPTYHRFRLVATYIELEGTREDLPVLDRFTVEHGHLFGVDSIRKSTEFAVKRRILNTQMATETH